MFGHSLQNFSEENMNYDRSNYKISDLRLRGIMIRPSQEEQMAKKLKSDFVVNYSNMVTSPISSPVSPPPIPKKMKKSKSRFIDKVCPC